MITELYLPKALIHYKTTCKLNFEKKNKHKVQDREKENLYSKYNLLQLSIV